jgi:hypothetical protein
MDEKDLALHKGLMKILNDGDFTLKVREVPTFVKVYEWANQLPQHFTRKPVPRKKKNE